MPQPADLVKIVTVFDLLNDDTSVAEVAEFGMWGQLAGGDLGPAEWDPWLQDLAQLAVDKWSADISPGFYSHGAKLKQCRAIRADAAGHTVNEQVATPGTPWSGDATHNSLPWASTLVVSLYTYTPGSFIAHAGRRRGRVYPPPLNVSIITSTNQGTVSSADALSYLNDFKGWLSDVSGAPVGSSVTTWILGVLSVTGDMWNHVTDLAVDTKIDTQRRREKSQPAVRQSVSF